MLDVFHYFAVSGYSIEGVMSVLNGQEEVLKKICLKAGIDPDKNMLDELFAGYVSHYKKLGANYEDIGFLNSGNTEQFPKTRELLTEMGL